MPGQLFAIAIKSNNVVKEKEKEKNTPIPVYNLKTKFVSEKTIKECINFSIDVADTKSPQDTGHYYYDDPNYTVHVDRLPNISIFVFTDNKYGKYATHLLINGIKE